MDVVGFKVVSMSVCSSLWHMQNLTFTHLWFNYGEFWNDFCRVRSILLKILTLIQRRVKIKI